MIWTITLWLGMQGQTPATNGVPTRYYTCMSGECDQFMRASPCDYPDKWQEVSVSEGGHEYMRGYGRLFACKPPAEHVFEIRTKREDHGTAKDERSHGLGGTPHCDDPNDVLESPNQCSEGWCNSMYIAPHCVRVTHELWVDGKRLGIIKGLD